MRRVNGGLCWSWVVLAVGILGAIPAGAVEGRGSAAAGPTLDFAEGGSKVSPVSSFTLYILYAGMVALVPEAGSNDPKLILPMEENHAPYLRVFLENIENFCDGSRCCPSGAIPVRNGRTVVQCWWKLDSVELDFSPIPKNPERMESPRAGYSRFPTSPLQAGSPDWVARMSLVHSPFSEINRLRVLEKNKNLAAFSKLPLGELLSCHLATVSGKVAAYRFLNQSNTGYRKVKAVADAVVSRLRVDGGSLTIRFISLCGRSESVASLVPTEDKDAGQWRLDLAITNLPGQNRDGDDRGHFKHFYRLASRPQGLVMLRKPIGAASSSRSRIQPDCESRFISLCGGRGKQDGLSYSNQYAPIVLPQGEDLPRDVCSRPVCPLAIFEPIDPSSWGGS